MRCVEFQAHPTEFDVNSTNAAKRPILRIQSPGSLRLRVVSYRRKFRRKLFGTGGRTLLFIACFPKSGSTFLLRLIHSVSGFPRLNVANTEVHEHEQEFSRIRLERTKYLDGVCQQHVKGTVGNAQLAKHFGLRPVVLVRDIRDVVPSLVDHFHQESRRFPTGYVPSSFHEWSQEDQWMFVIKVHMPWYFNFLLSWHEAQEELPVMWVTYENLIESTVQTVAHACDFWRYPVTESQIEAAFAALNPHETRFNRGISGRGRQMPQEHQDCLQAMADACRLPDEMRRLVGLN